MTPYRVAFLEEGEGEWLYIEIAIDVIYFFDIVFSFLSAYLNVIEELIDDHRMIACHYLRFWFFVDLLSILPFRYFFNQNMNSLSQMARITRIYRITKTFK